MARPSKPWYWEARGCWAVTINGKRHQAPKSIGPREDKKAWDWHDGIVNGTAPVTVGNLKVADLCELYLAWDVKRVSANQRDSVSHGLTVLKLTRACATTIDGVKIGRLPATSIRKRHLESMLLEWQAEKKANGKRLSTNYCRDLGSTFKAVFNWAVGKELLQSYPFVKTPLPPAPKAASRFATRQEAAQWLRFLWRQGLKDFAFLQRCLIHSGARPSELTRATWDEITWKGWTDKAGHKGAIVTRANWKSSRKTGEERMVYLPASLCRSLRRRMRALPDLDSPIFQSPRHQKWTASNLATTTQRFLKQAIDAGLPFKSVGPDRLVCYRWRHTAASSLLMKGVPIAVVAKLLGTSPQMIAKTYGHIQNQALANAASML